MCGRAEKFGVAAAQIEGFFQIWLDHFEIVGGTSASPDIISGGDVAIQFGDEFAWHFNRLIIVAAGHAHQRRIIGIGGQLRGGGLQFIQQRAYRRIGEMLVRQAAQRGKLPSARCRATRRHVRGLIPA